MTRWLVSLALITTGLAMAGKAWSVDLQYEQVSERPSIVDIRHAGDGSGRLFLVEQAGRIWILENGAQLATPFLDIRDRVRTGGERGLLSLAFAPDYEASGRFYTWYTDLDSDTVLSRFRVSANPDEADPGSEQILLDVDQPQSNHNGGQLQFGPDGMLWLGIGDGGGGGDPQGAGQDLDTLLGKLIRIDVSGAQAGYAVPSDNPRVGLPGRDEIWSWGLRNPWRMAFDPLTGGLFVADVGQGSFEEVNHLDPGDGGGENFGWNRMEGNQCYQAGCDPTGLELPVGGYGHSLGCSVTGGVVYRGSAYPDLHGSYLFGDYCSGRIWGLRPEGQGWNQVLLDASPWSILTFGTGENGDMYLSASGVGVFRVTDGPTVAEPTFFINPGLNDAWFEPRTAGQGFFINVFPEQGMDGLVFLAWFTFDTQRPGEDVPATVGDPGHRWLTAIGPYVQGKAELEVNLTQGGVFDSPQPAPRNTSAGVLFLEFSDCESGTLRYEFPALGLYGAVPIRRVASDNVALCEALVAD